MLKAFFSLLLFPLLASAQNTESRFENDTLYTSSGYKIFSGQTLEFNKGLKRYDRFRHVTIKNGFLSKTLFGKKVIVKRIIDNPTTVIGTGYVNFTGYVIMKDNSREYIVIHMAYDYAIEDSPVLPSELKVADEFRNKKERNKETELITALNLYEDKVITKAEYNELIEKIPK